MTLSDLTAEEQANAVAMVQALFAAPVETFQPERFDASWGGSVRAGRKATLTVKASEDVDAITVDGVTVSSYTTRTERTGWGWWSPRSPTAYLPTPPPLLPRPRTTQSAQ